MMRKEELRMPTLQPVSMQGARVPGTWKPICCGQDMFELVRRMILGRDGTVTYCGVWNCSVCGRLLL